MHKHQLTALAEDMAFAIVTPLEFEVAEDVERVEYTNCASGAAVVLYIVEGGGHTWPGGPQYLPEAIIGPVSNEFDASETIWAFVSGHSL